MLKIVLKFVLHQYEGCLKGIPPSTYLRIIIILFRHPLSSKKNIILRTHEFTWKNGIISIKIIPV